jgi:cytochrome oxidase Cu insertion factor (SCO1/SenC/PrrC family)
MSGYELAWASLAILVVLVGTWFTMLQRVQVERVRWLLRLLAGAVVAVAVFAFLGKPGIFGGIVAGLSLVIAGAFLILSSMAAQSAQPPALAVGDPMLEFSAADENGEIFDSASLRGRPMLLKFFRGHW